MTQSSESSKIWIFKSPGRHVLFIYKNIRSAAFYYDDKIDHEGVGLVYYGTPRTFHQVQKDIWGWNALNSLNVRKNVRFQDLVKLLRSYARENKLKTYHHGYGWSGHGSVCRYKKWKRILKTCRKTAKSSKWKY